MKIRGQNEQLRGGRGEERIKNYELGRQIQKNADNADDTDLRRWRIVVFFIINNIKSASISVIRVIRVQRDFWDCFIFRWKQGRINLYAVGGQIHIFERVGKQKGIFIQDLQRLIIYTQFPKC